MNKKPPTGDYPVGYGKPPVDSQFKPGNRANPNGRPKGSPNLSTLLKRAARQKVTVTEHGRRRSISMLELTVKQLLTKSAGGDTRAIQLVLDLYAGVERTDAATPTTSSAARAAADAELLKALKGRLLGGEPKEN